MILIICANERFASLSVQFKKSRLHNTTIRKYMRGNMKSDGQMHSRARSNIIKCQWHSNFASPLTILTFKRKNEIYQDENHFDLIEIK